jgi:hypothetical protein
MFVFWVLALLAVFVLWVLMVASTKPDTFSVQRSLIIKAPAKACFDQVNEFKNWEKWSPWEDADPAVRRIYEGPAAGVGSIYHYQGTSKLGEGRLTITESRPAELVHLKLEFLKPFKATHDTEITFNAEGDRTTIYWRMFGHNNLMAKVMHLFMNMDRLIGDNFIKSMERIKKIVEA